MNSIKKLVVKISLQDLRYRFAFLFLLSLFSCEESVDWEFHPYDNGNLVVDAILTNEFKTQEIKLSLSYDSANSSGPTLSHATVYVSDGEHQVQFIESTIAPGIYKSELPFATRLNKTYTLDISYNTKNYQAQSEMVNVTPIDTLLFNTIEGTDSLRIASLATTYNPNQQAMYEIDIDWSHFSGADSSQIKLFFYALSTIDVNELLPAPREDIMFPKGSIVIEKKYSLSPAFALYLRSLLLETEWQGSFFDESSSSLSTNISNGGLGFFAVSAVLSDTLVAK